MATSADKSKPEDADDQRAKFKAALDAKKTKSSGGSQAHEPGSGGPVKDHSSRSGGKREFRRKSGG
jgi:hypothetical protein